MLFKNNKHLLSVTLAQVLRKSVQKLTAIDKVRNLVQQKVFL